LNGARFLVKWRNERIYLIQTKLTEGLATAAVKSRTAGPRL